MSLLWITPAGNLGTIPDMEYYELPLDVRNSKNPQVKPAPNELTFSLVAGNMPPGLALTNNGNVMGVPALAEIEGVPSVVTRVITYDFTIRVSDGKIVADRTFSITVAGITPIKLVPEAPWEFFDGDLVLIQLLALEYSPDLTEVWKIASGSLPPGLSLSPTGIISGYILSDSSTLIDPYEVDYTFTITVTDGATSDNETYTIKVVQRSELTVDVDNSDNIFPAGWVLTVDNSSIIKASEGTEHNPLLMNFNTTLDPIRQGSNFAYRFIGVDLDGDVVGYRITSGALPPGLTLDSSTGWLHGFVPYGSLGINEYEFAVQVYKLTQPTIYVSEPRTFYASLLGLVDNTVIWNTDSDLGAIDNGAISDVSISAYTKSNRPISYRLHGTDNQLPIGLSLLSDGNIVGKTNFQVFKFDNDSTTFDNNTTTFDRQFAFTVEAYDTDGYVTDLRTFYLTVKNYNKEPYNNLYLRGLLPRSQRAIYAQLINNSDVFPSEDVYRASDPNFGKNVLVRFLFQSGLSNESLATYAAAMEQNHYWKKINFGSFKTARALDDNLQTKYEVVYVELEDDQQDNGVGPNMEVNLPENTAGVVSVFPNSFSNMAQRIIDGVGIQNRGVLPEWMTSRQEDGKVLGFTRAFVLCYTQPGRSKAMAYRISQFLGGIQLIDFTIDRYELEFTYPLWDSGTQYHDGDIVLLGSNNYISKDNHTATQFDQDLQAGHWDLYVNGTNVVLPDWASSTLYTSGKFVNYGGTVYECVLDHIAGSNFTTDLNQGMWVIFTNSYDYLYLKFPQTNILTNVCY